MLQLENMFSDCLLQTKPNQYIPWNSRWQHKLRWRHQQLGFHYRSPLKWYFRSQWCVSFDWRYTAKKTCFLLSRRAIPRSFNRACSKIWQVYFQFNHGARWHCCQSKVTCCGSYTGNASLLYVVAATDEGFLGGCLSTSTVDLKQRLQLTCSTATAQMQQDLLWRLLHHQEDNSYWQTYSLVFKNVMWLVKVKKCFQCESKTFLGNI